MAGTICTINLQSKQKMGGDTEKVDETYQGSLMERDGKKYLTYKRTVEDGSINCLITFDRKSFSMTQKGALNSKLELCPGQKTVNKYGTPMGELSLQIYTRHYQVIETKQEIKVLIDYDIVVGSDPIETSMTIVIEL